MGSISVTKERNMGIELLRIVSMFLVVLLHVLGRGGVLDHVGIMTPKYLGAWFLEIMAYCAVNCFALVCEYVGVKSHFRVSRLINLWISVAFYTVLITGAFAVFAPGTVSLKMCVSSIFPITTNQYWYVTAYFGMSLFVPFMNLALEKAEQRVWKIFFGLAAMFFIVLPCVLHQSVYGFMEGYSTIWLCVLYLAGGYFEKYNPLPKIRGKVALLIFIGSTLLTFVSKIGIVFVGNRFLEKTSDGMMLVSYISPTMVISGIALLCFFSRLQIENKGVIKVTQVMAPAAFGVYLIHVHPLIWEHWMQGASRPLAGLHTPLMIIGCILMAFGIYLACSAMELLRIQLFKILKIQHFCRKADDLLAKVK